MNPFFSIIIPVFNVEKYLPECLESISAQTFKNIEVIIVDDGATDYSARLCDAFCKDYAFSKVIHKKNNGISSARNIGLDVAVGEYIVFIDSDDYWNDARFLEVAYDYIVKEETDLLVIGKEKYFQDDNKHIIQIPKAELKGISQTERIQRLMQNNDYVASAWDKIVRREIIEREHLRFVIGQKSEDIEWCIKLLISQVSICLLKQAPYVYRKQNSTSLSSNIKRENLEDICNVIEKYSILYPNDPLILNFLAVQYVQWLLISNLVSDDEISDLLDRMRGRYYLLKYDWYPYVKFIGKLRFLGFTIVRKILKLYIKIR